MKGHAAAESRVDTIVRLANGGRKAGSFARFFRGLLARRQECRGSLSRKWRDGSEKVAFGIEGAPGDVEGAIPEVGLKHDAFIDWICSGKGSACVAPWCVRAREGAKVSMPLEWDELPQVPPQGFSITEAIIIPEVGQNPPAQSISSRLITRVVGSS